MFIYLFLYLFLYLFIDLDQFIRCFIKFMCSNYTHSYVPNNMQNRIVLYENSYNIIKMHFNKKKNFVFTKYILMLSYDIMLHSLILMYLSKSVCVCVCVCVCVLTTKLVNSILYVILGDRKKEEEWRQV